MVEKRGDRWCVVHGHPDTGGAQDKPEGSIIKCFSIKEFGEKGAYNRALKMHKAILASQQSQKKG